MANFARHTLVHIAPDAWATMIGNEEATILRDWAAQGRPAIVRRALCDDADAVPIGVPLPPALGKRRIGLRCPPEAIIRTAPPPLLQDAAIAAPKSWQVTIATLLLADPEVRCFGGLAWQHLTGLGYLQESSDIDLVLKCPDAATADARAATLAGIDADAPMRIDAELVAPDGAAVQWREWLSGAPEILAKRHDWARLIDHTAVFA